MIVQPPYQVSLVLGIPVWEDVPKAEWPQFSTLVDATARLRDLQAIVPSAQLIDILGGNPNYPLPSGIAPFPVPIQVLGANPDRVSVYMLFGQLPGGPAFNFNQGIIYEAAGEITDRKTSPQGIDFDLGKCFEVEDPTKLTLQIDTSSMFSGPQLYWQSNQVPVGTP